MQYVTSTDSFRKFRKRQRKMELLPMGKSGEMFCQHDEVTAAAETNLGAFLFQRRPEVFQFRAEEGQRCFEFACLQVSSCQFVAY
jgi:hypothetical protein